MAWLKDLARPNSDIVEPRWQSLALARLTINLSEVVTQKPRYGSSPVIQLFLSSTLAENLAPKNGSALNIMFQLRLAVLNDRL